MPANPLPTKIGLVLFPGFQLMDVAGPIDALNILSNTEPLSLSILASSLSPVSTKNFVQAGAGSSHSESMVPTHTFADAPHDLEVLIVPGGLGSRKEENWKPVVEFLKEYHERVRWILTVCTGSELLAKAGLLEGRRATTNKRAFNEIKAQHPGVNWVAKARWVVDGNIWTASGISAGIDLAFAWIAEVYGQEHADLIADRSEYERNTDPSNDRFAERWGAV